MFNPEDPNPLLARWQYPFKGRREELANQRDVLYAALQSETNFVNVLDELSEVFGRFPDYLSVLSNSNRSNIGSPTIENEADLQTVVHAILRLLYADVRPEDPVPTHGGRSSRVDFLLQREGVIIETKMTRERLTDKEVGSELLIDWGRYQRHPDCNAIFGFVYDPKRYISNVAALEADLSQNYSTPATRVLVVR